MATEKYTVRQAREVLGLSRQELATATGLSITTIYGIENPNHPWDTNDETASRLASALALRVEEIKWPHNVTTRGRRPQTGGSYTKQKEELVGLGQCPNCYLILPRSGSCDCA